MGQMGKNELFQRQFLEILDKESITNVFQAIVSLKDGKILGYEALCRGPVGTPYEKPSALFEAARQTGKIVELEWLSKTKAVEKFDKSNEPVKLFVNIDPSFFDDSHKVEKWMQNFFRDDKMDTRYIIFEMTRDSSINHFREFLKVLMKYKIKNCGAALDYMVNNSQNLSFISNVSCPIFIKLDMSFIRDIHKDQVKQILIKTQVDIANSLNFYLIAEGIEQEEELEQLVQLGVHYGQGYYIQRPAPGFLDIHPLTQRKIYEKYQSKNKIKLGDITNTKVGEISKGYLAIDSKTLGKEVNEIFESGIELQGIPVVDAGKPVGLIMKHKFYRNLGKQYGYVIFMKRSIDRIMDTKPLTVDYDTPLDRASEMAMMREEESLYDYIIVLREGKYFGIVTVKDLLQKTTEIELNRAKYANPLTGLPGNILIEQKLKDVIAGDRPYSVLYFDLDNFKAYNDVYGFENGDRVIEMTAEVIEQRMKALEFEDSFFGHVGGDDFVAILPSYSVNKLCEAIIEKFDKRISEFYTELDRDHGYIMAQNRHGMMEKFPLMSLSIAVVNNRKQKYESVSQIAEHASKVKKKCKSCWTSNYIVE